MRNITYTPLERLSVPRPVDRIDWISHLVAGKTVLDLGAYDETSFDKKEGRYWLHGRMAATAALVVGVDSSEKLPKGGLITSERSKIIKGSIVELHKLPELSAIEVIVAGELIEHLPDTLSFLSYLKSRPELQGKRFILTTPNAACLSNFLIGLCGMENNDVNHLQVYSLKTLHSLFLRANFTDWRFIPYHEIFPEMIKRSSGVMKMATLLFQSALHLGEFLFPVLSGGWIAVIEI